MAPDNLIVDDVSCPANCDAIPTDENITNNNNSENAEQQLMRYVSKQPVDLDDTPSIENADMIKARTHHADHTALNQVLLDYLSPQLGLNEENKRGLKHRVLRYTMRILTMQLIATTAIVALFYLVAFADLLFIRAFELEYIKVLFDFLKFYISAVIVELISILFFIVKYVFDKSIVGLIKEHMKYGQ